MRVGVWDLEILTAIPTNGNGEPNWELARSGKCGVSCVVIWDSETMRPHLYDSHTLDQAIDHLNACDLCVGYNNINFDKPCLEGATGRRITVRQYDLLDQIWKALGHREKGWKLGEVAHRTFGGEKNGNGASAPSLAAQGRWAELLDYCTSDVSLTRDLWNHLLANGSLVGTRGEEVELAVPDDAEFV